MVPVHLVTREALHLYLQKVDEHGVLMFNVSNRYLDLRRVLDALAQDADLVALTQDDLAVSDEALQHGKLASQWHQLGHEYQRIEKRERAHSPDRW